MSRLAELIEREAGALSAYIRARVSSEEDSLDVMQDVFLALCSRWNMVEALDNAAGWLFVVARNRIVDLYRRRGRRESSLEALFGDCGDGGDACIADPAGVTPCEDAARLALRADLLAALDALPPEQRRIFLQIEIEGRRYADISAETGVPVNTLLSRKRRAMLTLKARMDPAGKGGDG